MRYFIEVCSGDHSFHEKMAGRLGLRAPKTTRYHTMLSAIRPGDVILHYVTHASTVNRDWRSAFVGESRAASEMMIEGAQMRVDLVDVTTYSNPVRFRDLKRKHLENLSPKLVRAIRFKMQAYIFEIEKKDHSLIGHLSTQG